MRDQSYKNLIVWQKSKDLVLAVYDLVSDFPKEEIYGLSSQMKRAAISIPSNIAEGSRRGSKKDFRHFLLNSFGSGSELETQIEISKELGFGQNQKRKKAEEILEEVMRMLNRLCKNLDSKPRTTSPSLQTTNYQLPTTTSAGFTLFETLVTILIFSLVFMIVSAAFVGSLAIQRRAFNLQAIEENMNFVLESMAKEIRVSRIQNQEAPCPSSPANSITLEHPVNGTVVYSLQNGDIRRSENGGASREITSNTIEVTRLQFCISGSITDDLIQPRITILSSVRSAKIIQQTTIDVQTTLSQRFLSN